MTTPYRTPGELRDAVMAFHLARKHLRELTAWECPWRGEPDACPSLEMHRAVDDAINVLNGDDPETAP